MWEGSRQSKHCSGWVQPWLCLEVNKYIDLPHPLQLAAVPGCDPTEPFFDQDSPMPLLAPVPTLMNTHRCFCLPSMPYLQLRNEALVNAQTLASKTAALHQTQPPNSTGLIVIDEKINGITQLEDIMNSYGGFV